MSACTITGTAEVTELTGIDGSRTYIWAQEDPEIHIARELLDNPEAVEFLCRKYALGEWCPHDPLTRHARHVDHDPPDLPPGLTQIEVAELERDEAEREMGGP